MEEPLQYSYEAYAEYHMIRQEILKKYFACINARTAFLDAERRRKNEKRRLNEFINLIFSLYSHFEAKLKKFRDSDGKGFDELANLSFFMREKQKEMTREEALKYFNLLQKLIDASGLDQIEKKKLKPEETWAQIEEDI